MFGAAHSEATARTRDEENRSPTDIELAVIRKVESENTINADTNKTGGKACSSTAALP